MAYYKQNPQKKTVTVDFTIEPTKQEELALQLLLNAGYTLKVKSEARRAKANAMVESEEIKSSKDIDLTKLTEAQKKEYEAIKSGRGKGHGFFSVRAYYKKCLEENKSNKSKK